MHRREHSSPGSGALARAPARALQRLAFWLAIVIPAGYGPLLVVGLDDRTVFVLVGLVAVHLACLLVGHDYSP